MVPFKGGVNSDMSQRKVAKSQEYNNICRSNLGLQKNEQLYRKMTVCRYQVGCFFDGPTNQ